MSRNNTRYIDQDNLFIDDSDSVKIEEKITERMEDEGQILEFKIVMIALTRLNNSIYTRDMVAQEVGVNERTVRRMMKYLTDINLVVKIGEVKTKGRNTKVYTTQSIDSPSVNNIEEINTNVGESQN